jgi:hypothetical protein
MKDSNSNNKQIQWRDNLYHQALVFNLKSFLYKILPIFGLFASFFQRFSLGGDKTTRDVSLDEIGAGEAIWTAMKDANSNCKQILANLICIRCASSSIVAVMLCATQWGQFFFSSQTFVSYELDSLKDSIIGFGNVNKNS